MKIHIFLALLLKYGFEYEVNNTEDRPCVRLWSNKPNGAGQYIIVFEDEVLADDRNGLVHNVNINDPKQLQDLCHWFGLGHWVVLPSVGGWMATRIGWFPMDEELCEQLGLPLGTKCAEPCGTDDNKGDMEHANKVAEQNADVEGVFFIRRVSQCPGSECMRGNNPVHQHPDNGKWYFYDETWADEYGPYDSEEQANAKLKEYCEKVLGH